MQKLQLSHEEDRKQEEEKKRRWAEEFKKKYQFKEKEIQGLTNLISKSYQSINGTIDNMKIAAKLESEVEALTNKVKKSTPKSQQQLTDGSIIKV